MKEKAYKLTIEICAPFLFMRAGDFNAKFDLIPDDDLFLRLSHEIWSS
ncbi:hypothetical protein J2Z37_003687 [Ammoniphilus resinae]|uniref:Uncharacterized protein n=1 Tax=Ammoniphilus resinae TaxID=861532 RepID=A0ABS4GTT8_9BACL|nr:hypothetical protein [Ammoniphilus resinae]